MFQKIVWATDGSLSADEAFPVVKNAGRSIGRAGCSRPLPGANHAREGRRRSARRRQ